MRSNTLKKCVCKRVRRAARMIHKILNLDLSSLIPYLTEKYTQ